MFAPWNRSAVAAQRRGYWSHNGLFVVFRNAQSPATRSTIYPKTAPYFLRTRSMSFEGASKNSSKSGNISKASFGRVLG